MRAVLICATLLLVLLGSSLAYESCSCTLDGQVDCHIRQAGLRMYQVSPPHPQGCYSILTRSGVTAYPGWTDSCNRLTTCYETCGAYKVDCDKKFYNELRSACQASQGAWGSRSLSDCYGVVSNWLNTLTSWDGHTVFIGSQTTKCRCTP